MKFAAPRGTHDVLPSEQPVWERVTGVAEELCRLYGYGRLVTPGFEDTDLFLRTSGEASDIVRKEMYTFADRGGRSLTLRPEGTAPAARAYVEHGLHREPQPVKLFMIAPMYRYAAPQKGRHREHWQWSVEALGADDPAVDAELIQLYADFLRRLGIERYWIELNSIGDGACRPAYVERLEQWLDAHEDALDEEARGKRRTSPLRVFDTKNESLLALLAGAPTIGESLCAACEAHFAAVRRYLDAYGVTYRIVPTLVRGLDYYTRTTFEFMGEALGAQSSLVGGGRYDGLVGQIGGEPTPGIGFGAGIERVLIALAEQGAAAQRPAIDLFFALDEGAPRERVLALMAELRGHGRSCETDYAGRSLKGQLTQARRLGARTTVVARADEATLRRHGERDQIVPLGELWSRLEA
ncbi:MAG: histidine--tRNA ligase [Actinobacteria bacterium]|nr:histidine--tRNA ligase [Actinomycetota bacterium]